MSSAQQTNIWVSGRESSLLDDMISGRKTIEGRLDRGKFSDYKPGDIVRPRRDVRGPDGVLRDGEIDGSEFEITAVRKYKNFLEMIQAEGWQNVIPNAGSDKVAAETYNRYYSIEDQKKFGVLAVEVKLVSPGGDSTEKITYN